MAREQEMKQTCKKHGAVFKAKVALPAIKGRPNGGRVGERVWGSPEPDLRAEEAATGRGGERLQGRRIGDTASAAQVDLLYRQIG